MIIDRFIEYMDLKGLNDNQVTVDCHLSVGLIGKARKGRSDLGRNTIEKILKVYSDLNRDWLLTGKGEMLKSAPIAEAAAPAANMVQVPADAWEVIKMQAASLQMKDAQIDRVITRFEQVLANYERLFASISGVSAGFRAAEANREGKNPPPIKPEENG